MVLSAQLASALAGTLLVIPMFFLGRLFFERRAGFWAALLFQCLPVSAHVIGDAISEATFFLFLTTSLLFAAQGLQSRSRWRLALCGLFGGLAYLTRPEGALVVVATFVVLLGMQHVAALRWPRRQVLTGSAALLVGAFAVGGPYVATIGRLTPKPTSVYIEDRLLGTTPAPVPAPQASHGVHGSPLFASTLLAVYVHDHPYDLHDIAIWRGLWSVVLMTGRAFQYVVWIPALIGLWWFRDRLRCRPGMWVLLVLCGGQGLLLWLLAAVVGYVSERHALILVLGGGFWAAAMLTTWVDRLLHQSMAGRWRPVLSVLLMAVATTFSLPSTLKALHANRIGHREVGHWLAGHAGPDDKIKDPYCWAHYYAGRVILEEALDPVDSQPVIWLVLEESDNKHARLSSMEEVKNLAKSGEEVWRWTPKPCEQKAGAEVVVVYRFPRLPKAP
jgi:4-amino-4-deoxy-L-arabinose transferase-like glycosyltransferase